MSCNNIFGKCKTCEIWHMSGKPIQFTNTWLSKYTECTENVCSEAGQSQCVVDEILKVIQISFSIQYNIMC